MHQTCPVRQNRGDLIEQGTLLIIISILRVILINEKYVAQIQRHAYENLVVIRLISFGIGNILLQNITKQITFYC